MVAAIVLSTTVTALVTTALTACVALFGLTFTRWGRRRTLTRYAALSIAAHLLLLLVAGGVRYGSPAPGAEDAPPVRVSIVARALTSPEETSPEETTPEEEPLPSEEPIAEPDSSEEPTSDLDKPEPTPALAESVSPQDASPQPAPPQARVAESPTPPSPAIADQTPTGADANSLSAEPQPTQLASEATTAAVLEQPNTVAAVSEPTAAPEITPPPPVPPVVAPAEPADALPPSAWRSTYSARGEQQRRRLADRDGGDSDTEDAVARGVEWLARAQRRDGAWDTRRWGGGREDKVLDFNRGGAGKLAETGVTGLALLALQGAGYTHLEGPYRNTVTSGLAFLIDRQQVGGPNDGDLAGDASHFARTYCHTMATFALAEAFAGTGDERLRSAVTRAVRFLERRQNPADGGWRYAPGDRGDMSQMGWAVMALRSAELGGVAIRPAVWTGIERFVDSVALGPSRGMACYRPGERPTPTMTAEALYCRQILGVARARPAAGREAVGLLAADRPTSGGRRPPNLYYWYYGTLALHHERETSPEAESAWSAWNASMKRALLPRQVSGGPNDGSWRPNTLWGGYGGRVYTTALATMCLEVYYRYDPEQIGRDPWLASRGPRWR
ncbi:MAG: hypothetical protein AAFV43_05835 [Planctomycetota bacterium]